MIIRKAKTQDESQIVKLLDEFNTYYYDEQIFSKDYLPFWEYKDKDSLFRDTTKEWLTKREYILFVADEDGDIVGYICGQVKERAPRVLDKEGYIHDWFVKKSWRHTGVGMKLYTSLIQEFKKNQCNRLGLLTKVGNKKVIDLYHKLGFIDESLTLVSKL